MLVAAAALEPQKTGKSARQRRELSCSPSPFGKRRKGGLPKRSRKQLLALREEVAGCMTAPRPQRVSRRAQPRIIAPRLMALVQGQPVFECAEIVSDTLLGRCATRTFQLLPA